jgi:chromosome segregation and condensation protein ScpB
MNKQMISVAEVRRILKALKQRMKDATMEDRAVRRGYGYALADVSEEIRKAVASGVL